MSISEAFARPEIVEEKLKKIPGIIETGLFLEMCDVAYVGRKDGRVDILVEANAPRNR